MAESGTSPFKTFLQFSDWAHAEVQRTHAIALNTLAELVFRFLVEMAGVERREAAEALQRDFEGAGRSDVPPFLKIELPNSPGLKLGRRSRSTAQRQARHAGSEA